MIINFLIIIQAEKMKKGGFTIPGEVGYEELTLKLADKWGADVIRDSDGTKLSEDIINAGYGIYSTICIIRGHNQWAKEHMSQLQQTFLMTEPQTAWNKELEIELLKDFFKEQFAINDNEESKRYWEVYDRTTGKKVSDEKWYYKKEEKVVVISDVQKYHCYTVSFLAYRIWEEISMYNHITNNWDAEHLMPIDPRNEEAQKYLYDWLETWCLENRDTTVVRFTSMFYNFVWMWGADERKRNLFTDWGSYDFTVSPRALADFEKAYGYDLCAEDFINAGKFHVTHMPPTKKQRDYMEFTNRFVVDFGKKLVELVHKYGKQAYVFYDDSWVGVEPYGELFAEFGFDGIIKCVFSGYEARLCAGVKTNTHEIRLHPYLFPVGLGGMPTFSAGGNPTLDAKRYWINVRRALLREPVDRIGLGGYIHLVEEYPDFCDYIEKVADEFRDIKEMHLQGKPYSLPIIVAVLHSWGGFRPWTLSGHFHETYMHDLIHVNEALAGMPVDVKFIDFEDVKQGVLAEVDVVINAGKSGSAWSGGKNWEDYVIVTALTEWVANGGVFIGIGEPTATFGGYNYFKMSNVLGIDEDTGEKVCHGRWKFKVEKELAQTLIPKGAKVQTGRELMITDMGTKVLLEENGMPTVTMNTFGKGKGIYLSEFVKSNANTRMLLNLLLFGKGIAQETDGITDSVETECAYYPDAHKLIIINNSEEKVLTSVTIKQKKYEVTLEGFETKILEELPI